MKQSISNSKTTNLGSYKLTFGIYKGKKLDNIPLDYITYLLTLKKCPQQVIDYHRENRSYLKLTEEDKLIARGPKHPYFKGYFTKKAIEWCKKNLNN